jgi:hypothetical protein
MHAGSTAASAVLRQRHPLDPSTTDAHGFEYEIEARELRVVGEPGLRPRLHATHLLRVDHLERISISLAALLLHLDDEQPLPTAQHEIELVATSAGVGLEKAVAAKAIVTEGEPFSAIHAAS